MASEETSGDRRRRQGTPVRTSAEVSDLDIVRAMRSGEAWAYLAFVERFHRVLLRYARRARLHDGADDELVEEVLGDLAIRFMSPVTDLPQNPRMYVITAFRRRFLDRRRDRGRRGRVVSEAAYGAARECGFANASDGAAGCSAAAIRASSSPDAEPSEVATLISRLSLMLSAQLSEEERLLLNAVADDVPQRQIADWLGVSHAVTRKRLQRLRARLNDAAMRHAQTLPPDDARELQRLLSRCRARIGASRKPMDPDESKSGKDVRPAPAPVRKEP